jgi:phage gp36-like protein
MAYCEQSDVEVAAGGPDDLIELTDQDRNGAVDAHVVDKCIARGDALINTYANKLFLVPFVAPVPDEIRELSAELAVYYLRKQRRSLTDEDRKDFESNVRWLEALSKGEVTIGTAVLPTKSSLVRDKTLSTASTNDARRDAKKGFW